MKPITHSVLGTFVTACSLYKMQSYEQFISEHIVAYQVSGETHLYYQQGSSILKEGQLLLARRNQFAKSIKVPALDKEYRVVAVILSSERLKTYAFENNITCKNRYSGPKNITIEPNSFIQSYFISLLPYIEQSRNVTEKMASRKANEAIDLLLEAQPGLEDALFDFADPIRGDIEEFMLKNFHFNAPIEDFARLSGRSLTSFKREFAETFKTSPAKWLKNKRLSEAFYLIKQKHRRPQDIYLQLGFENLSHFYSSFKQKYGQTPGEIKLRIINYDNRTKITGT
jgi:AraC-like DNA-binding protein